MRAFPIAVALAMLTLLGAGEPAVVARPAPSPPPRVFVTGDETVRAFAWPLRELLTAAGVTDIDVEYALAAGVARPDVAGLDPDVVVLSYRDPDDTEIRALAAQLEAEGRRVYRTDDSPSPHIAERLYVQIARDFALPR